ncbi:SERTA domain-containing protein 3 [Pleurotus ostreatus]|nr:SERTA domain-containing protein 3 [Pleurotus ostreatus]
MSQTTLSQKENELTNVLTGVVGKRKRGNQGDFKGERLQYLNDMLPQYRKASSSGAVSTWFTNTFFPNYFRKFPWFIPAEDDIPEAFNIALEESKLTPEVANMKSDTVNRLVKKIKNWFNYRRASLGLNTSKDPWGPWLDKLRKSDHPRPQRLRDCQYYERTEPYKSKVAATLDEEWPTLNLHEDYRLATRNKIAERLLRAEPSDVQELINKETQKQYDDTLKAYSKGVWTEDVTDPDEREMAIESITPTIQPLLDGIRAITGLYIGFFAVGMPKDKEVSPEKLRAVYLGAGKSKDEKSFPSLDPKGFKQAMKLFVRFALTASGNGAEAGSSNEQDLADLLPTSNVWTSPTPTPTTSPTKVTAATGPAKTPSRHPSGPQITQPRPKANAVAPTRAGRASLSDEALLQKAIDLAERRLADAGVDVGEDGVGPELLEDVAKLALSAQEKRIKELAKLSNYELQRCSNIARNERLLQSLGLKDHGLFDKQKKRPREPSTPPADDDDYAPDSGVPDSGNESKRLRPAAPPRRSNRGGKSAAAPDKDHSLPNPTTPPRRSDRGGKSATAPDEDHPNPTSTPTPRRSNRGGKAASAPDEDHPNPTTTPTPRRSSRGKAASAPDKDQPHPTTPTSSLSRPNSPPNDPQPDNDPNDDSTSEAGGDDPAPASSQSDDIRPAWFTKAYNAFTDAEKKNRHHNEYYGPRWTSLLQAWETVEALNNFQAGDVKLPDSSTWPAEVANWIKSARYYHRTPASLTDVDAFAKQWWKWWAELNPDWRIKAPDGTLQKAGSGDWESMCATGHKGMINVIVCLWWWRGLTPETSPALKSWNKAVADVTWALHLEQMLLSVETSQ